MTKTVIDQINDAGQRVLVEVEEAENRRGRVYQTLLQVRLDDAVVYEGPDSPDAQAKITELLAASVPADSEPKTRRKKVTHGD